MLSCSLICSTNASAATSQTSRVRICLAILAQYQRYSYVSTTTFAITLVSRRYAHFQQCTTLDFCIRAVALKQKVQRSCAILLHRTHASRARIITKVVIFPPLHMLHITVEVFLARMPRSKGRKRRGSQCLLGWIRSCRREFGVIEAVHVCLTNFRVNFRPSRSM